MEFTSSLGLKLLAGLGVVGGAVGGVCLHKSGYFSDSTPEGGPEAGEQKKREEDRVDTNALPEAPSEGVNDLDPTIEQKIGEGEPEAVMSGQEEQDEVDANELPEAVSKGVNGLDPAIEQKIRNGEELTDEEKNKRNEFLNKKREAEMKKFTEEFQSFMMEDNLGLPEKCDSVNGENKYTSCTLSSEDLKKIKFGWLGEDGEAKVTPKASVDLRVVGLLGYGGGRRAGLKYLFSNGSTKDIVIRRGEKSVTLKANAKTGYTVEEGKLRREKLGKYGVPKRCEAKGNLDFDLFSLGADKRVCNLYEDDLAKIKFSQLGESEGPIEFKWKNDDFNRQSIMLTIENGKYIFCGNRKTSTDINTLTLSRDNVSLEIKGSFVPEGDKLKRES